MHATHAKHCFGIQKKLLNMDTKTHKMSNFWAKIKKSSKFFSCKNRQCNTFFEPIKRSYDLYLSNDPSQSKNRQPFSSEKVSMYLCGFSPKNAVRLQNRKKSIEFSIFLSAMYKCLNACRQRYDAKRRLGAVHILGAPHRFNFTPPMGAPLSRFATPPPHGCGRT